MSPGPARRTIFSKTSAGSSSSPGQRRTLPPSTAVSTTMASKRRPAASRPTGRPTAAAPPAVASQNAVTTSSAGSAVPRSRSAGGHRRRHGAARDIVTACWHWASRPGDAPPATSVPRPIGTPGVEQAAHRQDGVGEVGVGERAVGDQRRGRGEHCGIVVGDVVGVGKDRPRGDEAEALEGDGVGDPEAVERVAVRPVRLRAVRLDRHAGRRGELAEPGQQGVGARRREARRHDRAHEVAAAVDGADGLDRAGRRVDTGRRRRVPVPLGRARRMVHRDAPDERPLPLGDALRGERHRRRLVVGGEVGGGRRAVPQQAAHEIGPHRGGEHGVGVAGLERERVLEQPALERQVEARAELRPLRRVHVQVDEPGQQALARRQLDDVVVAAPRSGGGVARRT